LSSETNGFDLLTDDSADIEDRLSEIGIIRGNLRFAVLKFEVWTEP
jgi:hypothetical protein